MCTAVQMSATAGLNIRHITQRPWRRLLQRQPDSGLSPRHDVFRMFKTDPQVVPLDYLPPFGFRVSSSRDSSRGADRRIFPLPVECRRHVCCGTGRHPGRACCWRCCALVQVLKGLEKLSSRVPLPVPSSEPANRVTLACLPTKPVNACKITLDGVHDSFSPPPPSCRPPPPHDRHTRVRTNVSAPLDPFCITAPEQDDAALTPALPEDQADSYAQLQQAWLDLSCALQVRSHIACCADDSDLVPLL